MPIPSKFIVHGDYIEMILITKDVPISVLYDTDDHHWIHSYVWYVNREGYVRTNIDKKSISIHRLILNIIDDPTVECDHINRNPLDNRKCNLRITTSQGNKRNRSKWGAVEYIGVSKVKLKNDTKYLACIKPNNNIRQIKLGRFETEIDAARHYDSAAHYFFGEYANLNFPHENIVSFESWFDLKKLKNPKRKTIKTAKDDIGILIT